jgi:benzodiazapine receptor
MHISYIIIPCITLATMLTGSYFTWHGMDWYNTLKHPSFTPPSWVFSFVWTILYTMIAYSAVHFWNTPSHTWHKWTVSFLFIFNAILNVTWCYLFFYKHMIGLSLIEIIGLNLTTISLIILLYKNTLLSSVLLIPYALWGSFATILTFAFWMIN